MEVYEGGLCLGFSFLFTVRFNGMFGFYEVIYLRDSCHVERARERYLFLLSFLMGYYIQWVGGS